MCASRRQMSDGVSVKLYARKSYCDTRKALLMIDKKVLDLFLALQEVKSFFDIALRVHLENIETNIYEGSRIV